MNDLQLFMIELIEDKMLISPAKDSKGFQVQKALYLMKASIRERWTASKVYDADLLYKFGVSKSSLHKCVKVLQQVVAFNDDTEGEFDRTKELLDSL